MQGVQCIINQLLGASGVIVADLLHRHRLCCSYTIPNRLPCLKSPARRCHNLSVQEKNNRTWTSSGRVQRFQIHYLYHSAKTAQGGPISISLLSGTCLSGISIEMQSHRLQTESDPNSPSHRPSPQLAGPWQPVGQNRGCQHNHGVSSRVFHISLWPRVSFYIPSICLE